MLTRFPFHSAGALKVLRYQPVPDGKKPPPEPVGLSLPGCPSMLQSCGRSTLRQFASSNERASAPVGSPARNLQLESAEISSLAVFDSAVASGTAASKGNNILN